MRNFLIGALVFGMLCLSGSAAEDEIILNIGDGVTWEAVFDAGFRPIHLSDGIYMCRQYDVNLLIENSGSSVLNLGRGDVDFSVKQDGLLVLISFYGRENRTVQEAKKKTNIFTDIFKNDLIRKADLKTFTTIHKVDYSGKIIDPPALEEHVDLKTASNAAKVGNFSVIYSFACRAVVGFAEI